MDAAHRGAAETGVAVAAPLVDPVMLHQVAVLHGDEVFFQEDADGFYYSVSGHPGDGGDGVVAGMAGVCPAILNQQQVGVHHEGRRWKVQQEDFVGECEKFPVFRRQKIGGDGVLSRDQSSILQGREIIPNSTFCLVDAIRNHFRSEVVCIAMGGMVAQIGQDHERNRFELVLPHRIGEREARVARISPGPAEGDAVLSH